MNWMGSRGATSVLEREETRRSRSARDWIRRNRRDLGLASVAAAGPSLDEIAEQGVRSFRDQAVGMRCGHGPVAAAKVRVVTLPAAGITDPAQLEIWVLFGDVAEAIVPPHWDPTEVEADPFLTAWALQLRATAQGHLSSLDWPAPDALTVRFDHADRVERRGGRAYLLA
ncbi:MAG: hypothetical protein U0Q03_04785 [Acidimicrobiales bacterium]